MKTYVHFDNISLNSS